MPPCHQTSQSFALPPVTKPVSHLTCPLPPCHRVTAPLCHCITTSPYHRVSQSFALAPATKPVSHLPCPLPPNQLVIWLALYHCITVLLSHLPCPLPPNQSVICLAPATKPVSHLPCPCHQTSQSFDLPSTTTSLHHHVTVLVSHLPCSLPPNQSVIWLALYHRVTVSLHHCVSQSFALPPATKPVSHLPCPCHQTSKSFDLPSTASSPC